MSFWYLKVGKILKLIMYLKTYWINIIVFLYSNEPHPNIIILMLVRLMQ